MVKVLLLLRTFAFDVQSYTMNRIYCNSARLRYYMDMNVKLAPEIELDR